MAIHTDKRRLTARFTNESKVWKEGKKHKTQVLPFIFPRLLAVFLFIMKLLQ